MRKIQGEYKYTNVTGVVVFLLDGNLSIVSECTYNKNYTFFVYCVGKSSRKWKNI